MASSFINVLKKVDGIDIIVGGHTNTLLWNGEKPPNFPKVEGTYPTVVKNPSGGETIVIHTNGYGRFLGDLTVTLSDDGRVVKWAGNPVLLDKTVEKDSELLKKVLVYKKELDRFMMQPIGRVDVELYGGRPACRLRECSLGSFLADAMASTTGVPIGVINSGVFKGKSLSGTKHVQCFEMTFNQE